MGRANFATASSIPPSMMQLIRGHPKKLFQGHFSIILTAWGKKNLRWNPRTKKYLGANFQDIWS